MTVLRDIVARFTVQVDDKPLTKFDRQVDRNLAKLRAVATAATATFVAVSYGAYSATQAASRVEENMNRLEKVFGANKEGVLEWSRTFGKEVKRSEYTMQESVEKFGSYFKTMLRGTGQDTTAMAKRFAELSTDIESFRDISNEEARMRLFSGIRGETEAVTALGIDISEGTMNDYIAKKGFGKKWANLNNPEKVMQRFNKILEDTQVMWGDAKDTRDSFANSWKGVNEQLKTLQINIGRKLIGPAKKLLSSVSNLIEAFEVLGGKTRMWQVLWNMAMGAGVVAVMALNAKIVLLAKSLWAATAASRALWVTWAPALLVAGGIFLIWEDIRGMLDGAESASGKFLTNVLGIQQPAQRLKMAFRSILEDISRGIFKIAGLGKMVGAIIRGAWQSGDEPWKIQARQEYEAAKYEASTGRPWSEVGVSSSISLDDPSDEKSIEARRYLLNKFLREGNDKEYLNIARKQGLMDDNAVKHTFLRDRRALIKSGEVVPNARDYAAGLSDTYIEQKPVAPPVQLEPITISAGRGSRPAGMTMPVQNIEGSVPATSSPISQTFYVNGDVSDATVRKIGTATHEAASDALQRQTAAQINPGKTP